MMECQSAGPDHVNYVAFPLVVVFLGISTAAGLDSTFLVYITVRNKLRQSSRFQFRVSQDTTAMRTTNSQNNGELDPFEKRIQKVRTQAMLYSFAFLNCYFWLLVTSLLKMQHNELENLKRRSDPLILIPVLLTAAIFPLQGFFNFFIYTRLKVRRWREAEPDLSLVSIWVKILVGKEDIPSSSGGKKKRDSCSTTMKRIGIARLMTGYPDDSVLLCLATPQKNSSCYFRLSKSGGCLFHLDSSQLS
jgi:hypothetical protein